MVVLLSDGTQVEEVEGGFHMRKKQMGMTALVPGLPVQVKGSYNAQNQLAADSVKFKGSDLKTATDIQAGVAPVKQQEAGATAGRWPSRRRRFSSKKQAMTQQQQEMKAATGQD